MKNFREWRLNEGMVRYNPAIDGPPLQPKTASGAMYQIQALALEIRTTFGLDERFAEYKQHIMKCSELLEQAAGAMAQVMASDPHKFHRGA